jgi:hypothetical protein
LNQPGLPPPPGEHLRLENTGVGKILGLLFQVPGGLQKFSLRNRDSIFPKYVLAVKFKKPQKYLLKRIFLTTEGTESTEFTIQKNRFLPIYFLSPNSIKPFFPMGKKIPRTILDF